VSNQPMETILSYAHPLSNALLPKIVLWPLVCVLIIRLVVLYSPFYSFFIFNNDDDDDDDDNNNNNNTYYYYNIGFNKATKT